MIDDFITAAKLQVLPLAGAIGAEIRGVDSAWAEDPAVILALREALLTYKVVFLRDQVLDYEAQVAFGRRLGPLTLGHPIFTNPPGREHLREFDSRSGVRANHWHTDLTFLDRPPAFALLYSEEAPEVGGDTMWANAAKAYDTLPQGLRQLADSLRIVHSNDSDYTDATVLGDRLAYVSTAYEAEHSAVQVHPETGERYLLLGGFARRISGLPPQASRDLLRILQEHVVRPEHTVRWRWRAGDLAIWDNMATQHYAIYDYGSAHRRNVRITISGGVPIGADGRPSIALAGQAASYQSDH